MRAPIHVVGGPMLIAYVATLASFLALDALWLKGVIRPVFEADAPHLLADNPKLGVAAGFYVLYCATILWFAVRPALAEGGSLGVAALNGALLGFAAYGCYELTNMATLRGWTWRMVGMDLSWGVFLTAVAATVGAWAGRAV
jgi:uncharacterized membrane protein